ncbi:unknown protein [Seminavis robusta]|uniref:Uncharacterized protein n=1 Tax=Seminavis robusta TaxID=568900 RepID=A0A9N8DVS9_9STRA|nr:unknown protein [Seminavis robusta]|eukprot:Sro389_g132610.1 n/a (455) ;mRNA; f:36100-37464
MHSKQTEKDQHPREVGDWVSVYGNLADHPFSAHRANVLFKLHLELTSMFELAATTLRQEEHLAMLTVNGNDTITLSHHLRATSYSRSDGPFHHDVFVVFGLIGKSALAPLLQLDFIDGSIFEQIDVVTPANSRLLKAAQSGCQHQFANLQILPVEDEYQPSDLADVQTDMKSFIFVPPHISVMLLKAPNYMPPYVAAHSVLSSFKGFDESSPEYGCICSILRWIWCAQQGLLKSTVYRIPDDDDCGSKIAAALKKSYLVPPNHGHSFDQISCSMETIGTQDDSSDNADVSCLDTGVAALERQLTVPMGLQQHQNQARVQELMDITKRVQSLEAQIVEIRTEQEGRLADLDTRITATGDKLEVNKAEQAVLATGVQAVGSMEKDLSSALSRMRTMEEIQIGQSQSGAQQVAQVMALAKQMKLLRADLPGNLRQTIDTLVAHDRQVFSGSADKWDY